MKDNILCFASYKLSKEKKEDETTFPEKIPPEPLAQSREQVTLQILKLRKDLDALHALVTSL